MFFYGPLGWQRPGVLGFILVVLFFTIVFLLIGSVVRSWRGVGPVHPHPHGGWRPPPGMDPALSELRVRYARGDISWEDFTQRAANLGFLVTAGPPPAAPPDAPVGAWPPMGSSPGAPPA